MSKVLIIDDPEGTRVPFLRGILTHRLIDAGLGFGDAYGVATAVRDELLDGSAEAVEVRREELIEHVAARLRPFGDNVVERYLRPPPLGVILVRLPDGETVPFSRGRLRRELMATGLDADTATTLTATIHDDLIARGVQETDVDELSRFTEERLAARVDEDAARRYRSWLAFRDGNQPLILLVGGAPGTGKSTIASQVAHVLEIPRTQSTDMLREVMRRMLPEQLVPALHVSSFQAWERMPATELPLREKVVSGFRTQTELLSVAFEAVMKRAANERISIILEGVHIHPGLQESIPGGSDAVVVPIMLAVLKPKELKRRLRGRGGAVPERRSTRYLDHFDEIWALQDHLLSEADRVGVPIISNDDKDQTVAQMMRSVMRALAHQLA